MKLDGVVIFVLIINYFLIKKKENVNSGDIAKSINWFLSNILEPAIIQNKIMN